MVFQYIQFELKEIQFVNFVCSAEQRGQLTQAKKPFNFESFHSFQMDFGVSFSSNQKFVTNIFVHTLF